MRDEERINPRHGAMRQFLRLVGPVVALVGLAFLIVGLGSFFSSFGTFESPRYFWCAFVGMPLLAFGSFITKFAYLGTVFRYVAGEVAPVQKDTFNYLAEGTKGGVRTMASALGEGLATGMRGENSASVACPKCDHANDADANFCGDCGAVLAKPATCSSCGRENEVDANFCDGCGHKLR